MFESKAGVDFGWNQSGFYIRRGRRLLHSSPLSQSGWHLAWSTLASDYPQLASKVAAKIDATVVPARQLIEKGAQAAKEIAALQILASVPGCTFLGGRGYDTFFPAGTSCILHFTSKGIWIRPVTTVAPILRSTYTDAAAVDFLEPSLAQQYGRDWSLGAAMFGPLGAIWALVNPASRSVIRYESRDRAVEVLLSCRPESPEQLRARLSPLLTRIQPFPGDAAMNGADHVVARLAQLAELHRTGALSDDEFATLKAKLIADMP